MRITLWLAVAIVVFPGMSASAQNSGKPMFVLNTGGPVRPIRALQFSPDSNFLYSAGMDKAVQMWGLRSEEGKDRVTLIDALRWEISRGNRGVIYALTVSPTDGRIAIAGDGARSSGDIVVYDSTRRVIERVLPKVRQDQNATTGHTRAVVSLAYSPDGTKLASMSIDGELRIWSAPNWNSRVLGSAMTDDSSSVNDVAFLSANVLVACQPIRGEFANRLVVYNLNRTQVESRLLDQLHTGGVSGISASADTWASADHAGNVYLWTGVELPQPRLLRKGRPAFAFSFGPSKQLLVGSSQKLETGGFDSSLELWDTDRSELLDEKTERKTGWFVSCALSPNGERAVSLGAEGTTIRTFRLMDAAGQRIAKPFSGGAAHEVSGSGKPIGRVSFSENDSSRIGYGPIRQGPSKFNDYGEVTKSIQLSQMRGLDVENLPNGWPTTNSVAVGWSAVLEELGTVIRVKFQNEERCLIRFNILQGTVKSYAWILGKDRRPTAIALGMSEHSSGIFVYELANQGECRLLRYYRDHNGAVLSLSVSPDGKYLASGSDDQTIKIWSLEGLNDRVGVGQPAAWGATLEETNGKIRVVRLLKSGIAKARGLREGDLIHEVRWISESSRLSAGGLIETIRFILNSHKLWQSLQIAVERGGKVVPLLPQDPEWEKALTKSGVDVAQFASPMVPGWEPLMTLFVNRQDEWAAWTPLGYYNASIEGDKFFGWQINRARDQKPDFFRAEQFRKDFERPDVLRNLLAQGNVEDALSMFAVPAHKPDEPRLVASANSVPRLTIVEPVVKQKVAANQRVKLVAQVEYPGNLEPTNFSVTAFVNKSPLPQPVRRPGGARHFYEWEFLPREERNHIRVSVRAAGVDPALANNYVSSDLHFLANAVPPRRRVHVLALAADKYSEEIGRLRYSVKDAEAIVDRIRQHRGVHYDLGRVEPVLKDQEISVDAVKSAFGRIKSELVTPTGTQSSDLVIVFLSGHGVAFGNDYYFVPPDSRITSFNNSSIRDLAISWKLLTELSLTLPCQRVFILDTCHSGAVANDDLKTAVRPLDRSEAIILTATADGESAIEDPLSQHGYFTNFLLKGMKGAADGFNKGGRTGGEDGNINLLELGWYVELQFPLDKKDGNTRQNPQFRPRDNNTPIDPLIRYTPAN